MALSSSSTGPIPKTEKWEVYNKTINPGNNTTLDFVLRLEVAQENGIDFAVDDIEAYQLPIACIATKTIPVNIPCGQAFTAQITGHKDVSCAGLNDATVTIAAQNFNTVSGYQVSMNNGATWTSYNTSPATVPVPSVGYPRICISKI
ncbi:hypothetical protein [Flavobacterium davisii]|uniref:Uncharacterized protein n=1 Tax=Flavobacterium columnare TaxID=996 RepID=A0A8G0KT24_9FLAO|nr:hypothetical protein [Flavobacterium davisii]QYS87942.1 hypothetical protein JJC05_08480 [Flavobacterium davisii]